jgi:outer membrane protein insertion porin family
MSARRLRLLVALVWIVSGPPAEAARPAVVEISGHGFWGNRQLKRMLQLLETAERPPEFYDANFVEDAALILLSRLGEDGYLKPRVTATLTLADGSVLRRTWDEKVDTFLPRPLQAKRVRFRIQRGVLYYYEKLELSGLRALSREEAQRYFVEPDFLLRLKSARIYTPSRLERSVANLTEALLRKGFESAAVVVDELARDDKSGAVRVRLRVQEGLPSVVRSVTVEIFEPSEDAPRETRALRLGQPYSRNWAQDFLQVLRTEQYQRGFPDATAEISETSREVGETAIQLDLQARVQTGPPVTLGQVLFEGLEKTRALVVERRVRLREGGPLDRIAVDQGRHRLARLGAFETVDVRYEPVDETTRDVVYELQEGRTIDLSLLAGYGSYELLRGGFELEQHNLFGRAHTSRLRATQSFKASSADYLYTMPELIGEDIDVFFNASGLRREELQFTREEAGASIGARRYFAAIDSELGARYSYQFLDARDATVALTGQVQRARVAALALDLKHDRRDNPLLPRRGYKVFGQLELASTGLGGEVDYQRLELSTSYHRKFTGGRIVHLGLSHGVIGTLGGEREEIPFNKRFFPGGETSIRGYRQGQAAPRDAEGNLIGAETYLLGNAEFEQVLTPSWSVVTFVDAVGFATDIGEYPFDETLVSVGGGIRWKTIIGPAQLEYGHNLNPRRRDPSGALHISIGFPF